MFPSSVWPEARLFLQAHTASAVSFLGDLTLIISSHDKGEFLLPVVFDGASGGQAKLSFEHIGDTYFLSKVQTPAGVYTIGTRRAITKLAQMKDHGTVASSGN